MPLCGVLKMSLLSLPCELIQDIIAQVFISDSEAYPDTHPFSPNILSLSQTCQLLQHLSISYLYSSDIAISDVEGLDGPFADYPNITTYIRRLKMYMPHIMKGKGLKSDSDLLPFRTILRDCTKLKELSLKQIPRVGFGRNIKTFFDDSGSLLLYLAPSSVHSLETINIMYFRMQAALMQFKGLLGREFCALKSVRISVSGNSGRAYSLGLAHAKRAESLLQGYLLETPPRLESVRTFSFEATSPFNYNGNHFNLGEFIAKAMPNVAVMKIETNPEVVYGVLSTYALLGSQLTELMVRTVPHNWEKEPPGKLFCEIFSKLSPNLTNLVIYGGQEMGLAICHKLLAPEWPHLEELSIECWTGCEGIKPETLRERLETLANSRPRVSIAISRRYRPMLFDFKPGSRPGGNCIAPLGDFEHLATGFPRPDNVTYGGARDWIFD